jgi:metal-responsive CopG/Arc/MetJ family transcriptional regulator
MVNRKKPIKMKRNLLSVTIPQKLIDEIDALPSLCNRSEKTESLIRAGLFYKEVKRKMEEENGN